MFFDFLLPFFYSQLFVKPEYPREDLSGQTIIVTGANVGLGFEAARHFARLNASRVILAVRSTAKGEAAKKSIIESTGREGVVDVWLLDLSSYASVKAFAKQIETLNRLDAIVENAGIAPPTYSVSEDNESAITTNVISTFLLALLALPKLRESASKFNITPRLVVVSSEMHFMSHVPEKSSPSIFKELARDPKDMQLRYSTSKMLEVLYCKELAPALANSGKPPVTLNFLNPGFCESNLAGGPGEGPFILRAMKFFLARPTEMGARTLVASATAGHDTHGEYMSNGKAAKYSYWVDTPEGKETGKRVWNELNDILENIQPGVTTSI